MPYSIVQHFATSNAVSVPANTRSTVSCTLAISAVTAGNTLVILPYVICNTGDNTGPEVPQTGSQAVSDTLANSFTEAGFLQAGVLLPGMGSYYSFNVAGGADSITFRIDITNLNPIFALNQNIGFVGAEISGLTPTPTLQGHDEKQNGSAGAPLTPAIIDSFGNSVVTNYGSPPQQAASAIAIHGPSGDLFITGTSAGAVGAPSVSGATFSYTLLDGASAVTGFYGVDVGALAIVCGSPPAGAIGTPYSHTFPVTGGVSPYSGSIISGSLPPGLSLVAGLNTTVSVTGTPTTAGTYPFTVQVTDSAAATASVPCSITIAGSAVTLSCDDPPPGTVGVPYSYGLTVSGGTPPYTFTLISGSLPPGLGLDSVTGIISGTPVTPGSFSFGIRVDDSASGTAECSLLVLGVSGPGANVYVLRDHKLTDDDFGQIYPYYVTYFSPTADQKQQMALGGTQNLLAYLSAFIEANSYLHIGCNLTLTFYVNMLQNPWALTVQRGLPPNATFSLECGAGSVQGEKIAVKFESSPLDGQTDNAFNLQRVIFYYRQGRLPIRGSAS